MNTQDAIVVRNSLFVGKSEGIKQISNGVPTTVDCTTGVEASEDGAKYVQGSTSGCGKSTIR